MVEFDEGLDMLVSGPEKVGGGAVELADAFDNGVETDPVRGE